MPGVLNNSVLDKLETELGATRDGYSTRWVHPWVFSDP